MLYQHAKFTCIHGYEPGYIKANMPRVAISSYTKRPSLYVQGNSMGLGLDAATSGLRILVEPSLWGCKP
jgi:hypothetical protein